MVAMFVSVTVSRTEMLAESKSVINALRRSGVIAIRIGEAPTPTGIWVMTWLVEVSITATSSEFFAGQKREWAKAEEAKTKPKIINSKGRRYVFILRKWIKAGVRQSTELSRLIFGWLRFSSVWISGGYSTTEH